MKWLLIIAGAVVVLIVVVVLIGALLPRDHVATRSARIPAPPDALWHTIADPGAFPEWRDEHAMAIDASEPPRRLVRGIADVTLPFGGTWEYLVEPDGDAASRVTITERGSVYNPVFRFVSRFVMGHTATLDAYLKALDSKFARS
jgi:hypothetical protein